MKKSGKQRRSDTVLFTLTIVLFAALVFLSVSLLMLFNRSASEGDIPFDLARITSDSSEKNKDELVDLLLPEFIGVTTGGKRYGISGSSAVMTDLYGELSAAISETVRSEYVRTADETAWLMCAESSNSVYIRYHSELPDMIIGMFADLHVEDQRVRNRVSAYVYEMFIVPYSDSGKVSMIAVRSMSGDVCLYQLENASDGLTAADLVKYVRSYTSSMKEFYFAQDEYQTASATEPVFAEVLTTRNILTTDKTASLIKSGAGSVNQLMRVFGLNPNKLLSTHNDGDVMSYTDRTGVLYVYPSAFEYRASEDGGIDVEDIIGYTDSVGVFEYITAVYGLIDKIKAMEKHYTGGSADICLVDISSDGNEVYMRFEYFFDNIRIVGPEPALTVTFENGMLTSARLYTITVKNLSTRTEPFSEWWFLDRLKQDGTAVKNVSLVYRCDYVASSVVAEWRAVTQNERARRS